jgi:hypothetical protein
MTLEFGVPTTGLAGIGVAHFGSCLVGCEHPCDACACGISLSFPGEDFGFEALARPDPAVEALAAKHADVDLDHVQAAGMLGEIVELQPLQHAACFASRKSLVERTGRMPGRGSR